MKRLETVKLVCLMAAIGMGLIVDAMPLLQVAAEITVTKPSRICVGGACQSRLRADVIVLVTQPHDGLCLRLHRRDDARCDGEAHRRAPRGDARCSPSG